MNYEHGFQALKACVAGAEAGVRTELATLEARFEDNDRAERLFGPSEGTRATRAQIVYALNEFALRHCGASFNDLCDRAPVAGDARPGPTKPPDAVTGVRIDAEDPPYGVLRKLLMEAFSAEDLRRFCQERRPFRPVVVRFGPGQGLDDMVDEVLDHCRMQLLWDELVAEVAEVRPAQVARFADELRGG